MKELHVEAEERDVAVLHDIVLAFQTEQTLFLGSSHGAVGNQILEGDNLGADEAATANWGDKWRMPSKEEVDELTQHCNWIWTTHNNVNGYKVTGPNGNSIFLPAAGYRGSGPTYPAGEDGLYWTNTTEKQNICPLATSIQILLLIPLSQPSLKDSMR